MNSHKAFFYTVRKQVVTMARRLLVENALLW